MDSEIHIKLEVLDAEVLDELQLQVEEKNKRNNQFNCHLCSKVSDDNLALEMHLLEQHQVTTYKCGQCFYTVYELKDLVNHMTLTHSQSNKLTLHEALNLMKHSVCVCLVDKMNKLVQDKWPPPEIRKSSLHKISNSSTTEKKHISFTTSSVQHTNPLNQGIQDDIPLLSDADHSVTRSCRKRTKSSKDCPSKSMKVDFHGETASHQSVSDASSVDADFESLVDILPPSSSEWYTGIDDSRLNTDKKYKRIFRVEDSDEEVPPASANNHQLPKLKKRKKFRCPECDKMIIHLPRHLRSKHAYNNNKARYATLQSNQRDKVHKKLASEKISTDYHIRRECPVIGCTAVVFRPKRHMSTFHKLSRDQIMEFGSIAPLPASSQNDANILENLSDSDIEFKQSTNDYNFNLSVDDDDDVGFVPLPSSFNNLISKFSQYLASPISKEFDKSTISQHVSQLRTLMQYDHNNVTKNYRKLLNIFVITKILQNLKKPKKCGGKSLLNKTLRGYISSIKHLLQFFKVHPNFDLFMTPTKMETLNKMLINLSVGLKKGCHKKTWRTQYEAEKRLVSTQDINTYLKSNLRLKLINKLKSLNVNLGMEICSNFHTLVRGLIFIEISLDNANRVGEVRHLSLQQFNHASVAKNGSKIVKVMNRKTTAVYGYSTLSISKDVVEMMKNYRDYIRPRILKCRNVQITKKSPKYFFLTDEGKELTAMIYYMQELWEKVGLQSDVGPTLLHKVAVRKIHLSHPSKKQSLASKMNRTLDTASRYYLTVDREANAINMSGQLRNMTTSPDVADDNVAAEDSRHGEARRVTDNRGVIVFTEDTNIVKDAEIVKNAGIVKDVEIVKVAGIVKDTGIVEVAGIVKDTGIVEDAGIVKLAAIVEDGVAKEVGMIREEAAGGNSADVAVSLTVEENLEDQPSLYWSMRNHFTEDEERHLQTSCSGYMKRGTLIRRQDVIRILKDTVIGREIIRKFEYSKIKNKINFLKYRKNCK